MTDFDMNAAVESIGNDLGFGGDSGGQEVTVDTTTTETVTEPTVTTAETTSTEAATEVKPEGEVTQPAPTTPTIEPPKTWRKEAAAEWAKVPPVVQAEIAKREDDIFKGIESYKQDAGFGKAINQVIAPYQQILQQYNIDPVVQISSLMKAHYTLATGTPEQKQALFHQFAKDYGVQLNTDYEPPYVDPTVKSLQTEVEGLKSKLSSHDQMKLAEQQAVVTKQIEAFATDPKNIYFNEVVNPMAQYLKTGIAKTLEEAYEMAVYANPATRAKEFARQQAEAQQKAQAEAQAKVEATKKATATNIKTTAKSASAATPLGSIDETLQETLAAIKSRE